MSTTPEPRYTLAEARAELGRQECRTHGHSWDVISRGGVPVRIDCDTCGASYAVGEAVRPT